MLADTPETINALLRQASEQFGDSTRCPWVTDHIREGDFIIKTEDTQEPRFLYIDNPDAINQIPHMENDRLRMCDLVQHLRPSYMPKGGADVAQPAKMVYFDNSRLIEGRHAVPLSALISLRTGEALERAVISQLVSQARGVQSYMVSGRLGSWEPHSW